MTVICVAESLSWEWVEPAKLSLERWLSKQEVGCMYVDQLPIELESESVIRVEHDAPRNGSHALYSRSVLRGVLEQLRPERFLFMYEPAFLRGPLPAPQPVQGVDRVAQEYAYEYRTRAVNWMTGVPIWCELDKAMHVLADLDRGFDLPFAQAYCTQFSHDFLNPTNVLMLQSCEDVYMNGFEEAAESCNVLVMPWQSHCGKLLEFLQGAHP